MLRCPRPKKEATENLLWLKQFHTPTKSFPYFIPVNFIQAQEYFARYPVAKQYFGDVLNTGNCQARQLHTMAPTRPLLVCCRRDIRAQSAPRVLSWPSLQTAGLIQTGQFGSRVKVWACVYSRMEIKTPTALQCLSSEGSQLLKSGLQGWQTPPEAWVQS